MKSLINVRYNVYAPKAERNRATHLNRVTWTVYLLGSQFKLPRGASSLEQMLLLGHVITKQRCEIQSAKNTSRTGEALCATMRQSESFTVYTLPLFTMDLQ